MSKRNRVSHRWKGKLLNLEFQADGVNLQDREKIKSMWKSWTDVYISSLDVNAQYKCSLQTWKTWKQLDIDWIPVKSYRYSLWGLLAFLFLHVPFLSNTIDSAFQAFLQSIFSEFRCPQLVKSRYNVEVQFLCDIVTVLFVWTCSRFYFVDISLGQKWLQ